MPQTTADLSRKVFLPAAAGIVMLAMLARLADISAAPLWMDEAYSYLVSRLPLRVILFNDVDNHPPLFYALLHVWQKITPDPSGIRYPAAFAGILAVATMLGMMADFYSRTAAVISSGLLALSVGQIYYSQDARMYSFVVLGVCLAVWGLLGLLEGRENQRNFYSLLYVAGSLLAMYSHLIGSFMIASINLAVLGGWRNRATGRVWLVLNLSIAVLAVPLALQMWRSGKTFPGFGNEVFSWAMVGFFVRRAVGFPGLPYILDPIALFVLLASAGWGFRALWRSGRRYSMLVIAGAVAAYSILVLLINVKVQLLATRVFLPVGVPLLMLVGIGIAQIGSVALRWSVAIGLLAVAAGTAAWEHVHRTKYDNAVAALSYAAGEGYASSPIFTCHLFSAGSIHVAQMSTTRSSQDIFIAHQDGVLRFDEGYMRVIEHSIATYRTATSSAIDGYLGGGYLLEGGIAGALGSSHQAIVLSNACGSDFTRRMTTELQKLGFTEQARRQFARPGRILMERGETEALLFSR